MKTHARAISRRKFLSRLGVATAGLGAASIFSGRASAAPSPKHPNILLIMSDQHRWDYMRCAGHPLVQTPNMDRLAAQAVRFNTAYTQSPVCVPARMSIITGRYVHSHGALSNSYALPEDQLTFGQYFKELGYQTGSIGKMHFIDRDQQHGFDYRVESGDWAATLSPELRRWHSERGDDTMRTTTGGISPMKEEQTYEYFLGTKTIEWLRQHGQQPFCLMFSMVAPHPPFFAPERLYNLYADKVTLPAQAPGDAPPVIDFIAKHQQKWARTDEKTLKAMFAAYLGMITSVDNNIGRVLDELQRLGLADNTIVAYTADHGDLQYEHRMFLKFVMYDGSSRIPMIIRSPGKSAGGAVRQEVVEHVDLFPTFCELAGAQIPKTVQGKSLVPLLGGSDAAWPNTAFSELGPQVMVRTAGHKCNFYDGRPLELYDMQKDPREFYNLAGTSGSQETIAQMTRLRDEWMARTQPDLRSKVQAQKDKAGRQARRAAKGKKAAADK